MDIVRLDAGKLGARIRSDANGLPGVIRNAAISAAQRGRSFIIGKTPVDRGLLRVAWRVVKYPASVSSYALVDLVNDQPYAGIMEAGARPFKISHAGIEALTAWVKRKILSSNIATVRHGPSTRNMSWKDARKAQLAQRKVSKGYKKAALWNLDDEAKSIAYAIAKSFEKVGIKGRRFVYKNLPKLAELMDAEINRYLSKFFNRPVGSQK